MLTWYKKLYIGDNAIKKIPGIIRKVNKGKFLPDIYLITLAVNPENLLEILSSNLLMQKGLRERCPMIVGVARGYQEAQQLIVKIVTETYEKQGDTDVRRYLKEQLREQMKEK